MMIPQSFLAASLPFKVLEWYKTFEQYLIKTYKVKSEKISVQINDKALVHKTAV